MQFRKFILQSLKNRISVTAAHNSASVITTRLSSPLLPSRGLARTLSWREARTNCGGSTSKLTRPNSGRARTISSNSYVSYRMLQIHVMKSWGMSRRASQITITRSFGLFSVLYQNMRLWQIPILRLTCLVRRTRTIIC